MFAVVEFTDRKCAVVPLNWISEDKSECYWPPKCVTESALLKKVQTSQEPGKYWRKYAITKIIEMSARYEEAETRLQKAIDDSSSNESAGTSENALPLVLMDLVGGTTPEQNTKRKYSHSSENDESSVDFSDDDMSITTVEAPKGKKQIVTLQELSSRTSTPSSSGSTAEKGTLSETILKKVEHILLVQDQHSIILQNLLQINQTTAVQSMTRPQDMPTLPITTKPEFKSLEDFLKIEDKFGYMRSRLACIGGSNVRNAVMHMLRFLMSDKVAMKFNWAGRENKRAFKDTYMSKVIQEAVMLAFCKNGDRSDLTDRNVQDAIKDWLKLAKSRYENKLKRQTKD